MNTLSKEAYMSGYSAMHYNKAYIPAVKHSACPAEMGITGITKCQYRITQMTQIWGFFHHKWHEFSGICWRDSYSKKKSFENRVSDGIINAIKQTAPIVLFGRTEQDTKAIKSIKTNCLPIYREILRHRERVSYKFSNGALLTSLFCCDFLFGGGGGR